MNIKDFLSKREYCADTLKLIALITMFIDHIGAVVIERYLREVGGLNYSASELTEIFDLTSLIVVVYLVLRLIGRISFPIFAFLLVEGFLHTKSIIRYALRLFVFALISEIPFDLALRGKVCDWGYQNVLWTFLIGLASVWCIDHIHKNTKGAVDIILRLLISATAMVAAWYMNTDYNLVGVLCVILIYWFKTTSYSGMIMGCIPLIFSNILEIPVIVTIPLIGKYNGERGNLFKTRYFSYFFYPAHFAVLYLFSRIIGL